MYWSVTSVQGSVLDRVLHHGDACACACAAKDRLNDFKKQFPRFFKLNYTTLYYTIRYEPVRYDTILYYTILYYTILYYTILYYTILYYTILYYTILYYTILYYTIQGPVVQSPISANPGLTLNKTYGVNPRLALIGLWTTVPWWWSLASVTTHEYPTIDDFFSVMWIWFLSGRLSCTLHKRGGRLLARGWIQLSVSFCDLWDWWFFSLQIYSLLHCKHHATLCALEQFFPRHQDKSHIPWDCI